MKIKRMNWFFKLFRITGICLAPFNPQIREGYFTDKRINHEKIHWYQQLEVFAIVVFLCLLTEGILLLNGVFAWWFILFLVMPFIYYYIWYSVEWLIRIPINGRKAYMNLLFEVEAHDNDDNLEYLKTRKHFAWL